ncbi:hypothetical protein NVP1187O_239 [Vibrio phage 1.187.O._10N.286.49.F1]|nr:hypothetical protein NVP1187O_239 [Vibrio phage 1.187.O._10N.286.49.F1]
MIFNKQQAQDFDHSTLDFTKPDYYHTGKDLDLILVNGWLYSGLGLYDRDSVKFDNCLQAY